MSYIIKMENNVNWNLYRSFLTVYEIRNLHKASDVLGITRTAVQKNIKSLSRQIGQTLFVSHQKGVSPTEHATRLYAIISPAIKSIIEIEKDFSSDTTSIIKVAVHNLSADLRLKEFLPAFCEKYPNTKLEFFHDNSKVDFIIDTNFTFKDTKYNTIDLFSVNCAFVATRNFLEKHNLTQSISKADLLKLPFIARHETWEMFYQALDTTVNVKVTKVASNDLTYSMANSGMGVGCLSHETVAKMPQNDLVTLNVEGVSLPAAKIVCGYNNLSKDTKAFIDGFVAFCSH